MTTIVMERIGRLFISLQHIKQVLRLLTSEASPSMPATVRDTEVPHFFRERYVRAGYRPLHQRWSYYFLSAFRRHNETVNIWTHLLAFLVLLAKMSHVAETVDLIRDRHAWPLLLLMLSALNYTAWSVVAHLLGSKSEMTHYTLFFMDYVGVAQYQYSSALVHYYYSAEEGFFRRVGAVFMPVVALLSWLSCLGCCYGKYRNHTLPPWVRKVSQVTPSTVAYLWDISPVAHRLLFGDPDPAAVYHLGHVAFFLGCAVFFAFPVLERCWPGGCDFLGQGHQLFHVLLSCCTICQINASLLDYGGRRQVYARLYDGDDAALFVALYGLTLLMCVLIAAFMLRKAKELLDRQSK
ncbi:progestin and adipoQ receptor family member VII, a [Corythoichthys intestinalis]|uniref:progestin and adipoQ receptor family member VII, a n=1 Tax=Corythoichthys intestinalis TaxID=161448 RepID=UPI0025A565BE|nr:progestin and adipoQ receptor family member VII, a [Corythoichthys intestinalis]XP_057683752.1 progestin and adipoQ receptor family member VII, a [Corythoichthys intestinalis]XP_061808678.1 membrane progestin receptor alpha-B-like [Nerophis lumbriciformis]